VGARLPGPAPELLGRFEEAIAEAQTALAVEPASPIVGSIAAVIWTMAGRYPEALAECRRVLELDPQLLSALDLQSSIFAALGRHAETIETARRAVDISSSATPYVASLAHRCATAGHRSEAEALLRELEERAREVYVPPLRRAFTHGELGNADRAFEWLTAACDDRAIMVSLPVARFWDFPLREDPRFKEILQRVGLDQDDDRHSAQFPRDDARQRPDHLP
jgi:tetratricopeptide (TPR) repeat protein